MFNLSCVDWENRIRSGRSLVPDLPLDPRNAARAVAAFDKLRLADVVGNPTLKEACGDWFRDIVRALHGSLDPLTGERHIREVFCLVPKKNSKTSYGAGLMLVSLLLNERPRAVFLLVAPTQDVAELAFSQISGMIALDRELSGMLHVQQHLKKITDRRTGASLEVMSFDPSVLTGQKPAGILLDELHVVSGSAKASSAIGQLRGGMIAYPESFFLIITTQSEKPPAGVFRAELMKARAIRDGRAGGKMLPVLYEFPSEIAKDRAAWSDPDNWPMVTPNRGRSITIERLIEDFEAAQNSGEEEIRRWASQHLDLEIGVGLHSDRWVGADHWEARGDPTLTLGSLLERSEVVVCGIDNGGADDLLSLAVLGRDRDTRGWLAWGKSWAHRTVLERRKSIAGQVRDFVRDGDLVLVDSLPEDLIQLAEVVSRVEESELLATVGLDQQGLGSIVDILAEHDIQNVEGRDQRVVGISQGWKLTGAIHTAGRKLADGTLTHAAQPLMAWAVGNAKIEPRGNAVVITKQTAGAAKIDPLVALLNAVQLMSMNPEAIAPRSVYEDRGILII